MRVEYLAKIRLNRRTFNRVFIDDHYKRRHADKMNDALILDLCRSLDGSLLDIQDVTKDGWQILVKDPLFWAGKVYRLVICTHPDERYIGVINAFRRKYG